MNSQEGLEFSNWVWRVGIDESPAFFFYSKKEQEIISKRQKNKLTHQKQK
jgi:hypothetical protein